MEETRKRKNYDSDISLSVLESLFNANLHPEAINYQKVANEIKNEFTFYWDKLRKDDLISKENFIIFFDDVSFSVKEDEDFLKILSSFGFK